MTKPILLIFIYFTVIIPHLAHAHQDTSPNSGNENLDKLLYRSLADIEEVYESDILPIDGGIIERQLPGVTELENNVMVPIIIQKGRLVSFVFTNNTLWQNRSPIVTSLPSKMSISSKELLDGDMGLFGDGSELQETLMSGKETNSRSTAERNLYISVTTCSQPSPIASNLTQPPPQLQLYISRSPTNRNPGPLQDKEKQIMVELQGGFALEKIRASNDVFFGLYAKSDVNYSGGYSAQIAASIDMPYHFYQNTSDPNLFVADTDNESVLLYTDPFIHNGTNKTLVEQWTNTVPPFFMFAMDSDTNIRGLENSYCGLEKNANILSSLNFTANAKGNVSTSTTTFGEERLPRQQFYLEGLQSGSKYTVALAMASQNTKGSLGGGGRVFHRTSFSTLSGTLFAHGFNISLFG